MTAIKVIASPDSSREGIAANSLSVANGDLLTLSAGFVIKAVAASTAIIGVANGTKVYASDNQTVAKAKVNYMVVEPRETVLELPTSAATLAQTDVGKYYTLNASQQVDLTTGATAKGVLPLQLVEFVSTSKGRFVAVQ